MMIKNFQEQSALISEQRSPDVQIIATVDTVYTDGATLIFAGESASSAKHYKANAGAVLAAGDRVKIAKVSGTYIIEYAIGAPNSGPNKVYNDALVVCPFNGSIANTKNQSYVLTRHASSTDALAFGAFNDTGCLVMNKSRYYFSGTIMQNKLNVPFTLSAWVKFESNGLSPNYQYRRILWSYYVGGAYIALPEISSSGGVSTNKLVLKTTTSANAYNGAWHWICLTRTATGFSLRIDNSAEVLSYASDISNQFTDTMVIGDYTYPLNGYMAYFCFWDRVLIDAEMDYLWNNGTGNFT